MTGRPTPELAAKHAIAAPRVDATTFRTAWLIETRLDGLYVDRLISLAGLIAARHWRRDWEIAMERTHAPRLDGGGPGAGGGAPGGGPTLRLAAMSRLRAAERALGRFAVRLLEWCLVRDLPWVRIAARLGCTDKTARRWTAEAIAGLAAHHRLAETAQNAGIAAQGGPPAAGQGRRPGGADPGPGAASAGRRPAAYVRPRSRAQR